MLIKMTDYINNRPVKFCEYEHKLSRKLYSCLSKEPCEYKRLYPKLKLCKKRDSFASVTNLIERDLKTLEIKLDGNNN